MSFSNFLEYELLDHLFNIGSYAAPATYVGLSTADPGEDAAGLAEPAGGSYARVQITTWGRTASEVDTDSLVSFPAATASWGTITHAAIFDALTAGNMLLSFALDSSKSVDSGDTARFAAGELNITLD